VYICRLLDVEVSGWRNELRLRVLNARRRRPHVEVFRPFTDDTPLRLADGRWHSVTIALSATASDGGDDDNSGGFFVQVHIDCQLVAGRRVSDVFLPWTQISSDFDRSGGLSHLWVGQRFATESLLKASRDFFPFTRLTRKFTSEI